MITLMTKRPTRNTTRTALLYARISKDRSNEQSIEVQLDHMRRYCEMKGWTVVEPPYIDKGRSAYKGTPRPELDRLFSDLEAGVGNQLVVYKLDRLARSVRNFTAMYEQLASAGGEFTSVTEGFDTTTPIGKAMLTITAVFAELESDVKSERITDWHDQRKARGGSPTGPRPFGYGRPDDEADNGKLADHRAVIRADEAALIRDAAARVIKGESLRSIVAEWNQGTTRSTRGSAHTQRGLALILTSPHTAGLREIDGVLVKGSWDGILTRDQHDRLCSILHDPARRPTEGNAPKWLLSGIARCSLCDTPMGTVSHPKGSRYMCKPRKGHVGCGKVSIECERTDRAAILQFLDALDLSLLATETGRQRGTVNEQLDALYAELDDLARKFGDTPKGQRPMSLDYFKMMRDGIEQRIAAVQTEEISGKVSRAMSELAASSDPFKTFMSWDLGDRRSVLLSSVNFVSITRAKPGSGYDATRVDLVAGWKN